MTVEQPAFTGLAPRRRARRVAEPLADHLPVAQVVVDRPVPHLDEPYDYAVPASMDRIAQPGVRVRVRFGHQDVDGYCVARLPASEHELVPLRRVVSGEVVLTPAVLALARAVARRWVGVVPDVLRLAVPPRHAQVEAEPHARVEAEPHADGESGGDVRPQAPAAPVEDVSWAAYSGGGAFLRRAIAGEAPRAVWQALPGSDHWAECVADAVAAVVAAGRGGLVVVPSGTEVAALERAFSRVLPLWQPGTRGWVRLCAEDGPAARYRAFLAVARGEASAVIGTRGAAFAPVADLGLAVCWDDASDLHTEQRAPYPHTREVLALRSQTEGCALLVGGLGRSVAAQRWVESGWARPVVASRDAVRARTPRIEALTSVDLAREGPAAAARLPAPAWRAARDALGRGPVLVQVPRAGYLPAVACATCRALARCQSCAGSLRVGTSGAVPECRWCGRPAAAWRCPECSGQSLRSVRVGSERTAEELGRAFPGFPVRVSGAASGVLSGVPARPAIVVATPGAEPPADGGYAAALLLDAAVMTGRPALDVGEQALRSWMAAASLVRPATDGGVVLLVGDAAPVPSQALVRWDPAWFAERELAERAELHLPPAVHVVVLEGARDAVTGLLARADLPAAAQVVGPARIAPTPGEEAGPEMLLEPAGENQVRALVRTPWDAADSVTDALRAAVAVRSARREQPVRLRVQPTEVW